MSSLFLLTSFLRALFSLVRNAFLFSTCTLVLLLCWIYFPFLSFHCSLLSFCANNILSNPSLYSSLIARHYFMRHVIFPEWPATAWLLCWPTNKNSLFAILTRHYIVLPTQFMKSRICILSFETKFHSQQVTFGKPILQRYSSGSAGQWPTWSWYEGHSPHSHYHLLSFDIPVAQN